MKLNILKGSTMRNKKQRPYTDEDILLNSAERTAENIKDITGRLIDLIWTMDDIKKNGGKPSMYELKGNDGRSSRIFLSPTQYKELIEGNFPRHLKNIRRDIDELSRIVDRIEKLGEDTYGLKD